MTAPNAAAQDAWLNVACGLIAIGLALLLPTARRLNAEQSAEPVLRFEVASVKPNTSGTQSSRSQFQPGGRYVVSNGTIERLFRNAFTVQPAAGRSKSSSSIGSNGRRKNSDHARVKRRMRKN